MDELIKRHLRDSKCKIRRDSLWAVQCIFETFLTGERGQQPLFFGALVVRLWSLKVKYGDHPTACFNQNSWTVPFKQLKMIQKVMKQKCQ